MPKKPVHSSYCEFAKAFNDTKEPEKFYMVRFKDSRGRWYCHSYSHFRMTREGIFKLVNGSWQANNGMEVQVIEFCLDDGKVLFEGLKEVIK